MSVLPESANFCSWPPKMPEKKSWPQKQSPPPQKEFHDVLFEAKIYVYKAQETPESSCPDDDDAPPSIDDAINHVTPPVHPLDSEIPVNPPPLCAEPAPNSSWIITWYSPPVWPGLPWLFPFAYRYYFNTLMITLYLCINECFYILSTCLIFMFCVLVIWSTLHFIKYIPC